MTSSSFIQPTSPSLASSTTTRSTSRFVAAAIAIAVGATVTFAPSRALADEHAIIRDPGEHPTYAFEAEPHVTLGWGGPFQSTGTPGVGFRGTFHITNGFVKSINDSVGVGVGVDFGGTNRLLFPVVLQWNFWLSTHWSVFGEPGVAFASGPNTTTFLPAFFAGGRYHFTEDVALTVRIGYPAIAVGVSFFL